MKSLALALSLLSLSGPALAVSPCQTQTIKAVNCSLVDSTTQDELKLSISRYRVKDNGSGRCTQAGSIQESSLVQVRAAQAPDFIDSYLDRAKNRQPLTDLESGRPLNLELYSLGNTTEPQSAAIMLLAHDGEYLGHAELIAKVRPLFAKPNLQEIRVAGPLTCREESSR